MEQRSEEWFLARLGKVTASKVADVMARTKSGPSMSRKNYQAELLAQRLTGRIEPTYQSAAMKRGVELEPIARAVYEITRDVSVVEVGLIDSPTIKGFAASPDGLVGSDGLVEIKCPNTATHIEFLRSDYIPVQYIYQMESQMHCTGRNWCDYVSFDNRLPSSLEMKITRYIKNDRIHDEMLIEVKNFLKELDAIEIELREMKCAA